MQQKRKENFNRSQALLFLRLAGLMAYHLAEVLQRCATIALLTTMFRLLYVGGGGSSGGGGGAAGVGGGGGCGGAGSAGGCWVVVT
jgi:hypothetical protein